MPHHDTGDSLRFESIALMSRPLSLSIFSASLSRIPRNSSINSAAFCIVSLASDLTSEAQSSESKRLITNTILSLCLIGISRIKPLLNFFWMNSSASRASPQGTEPMQTSSPILTFSSDQESSLGPISIYRRTSPEPVLEQAA